MDFLENVSRRRTASESDEYAKLLDFIAKEYIQDPEIEKDVRDNFYLKSVEKNDFLLKPEEVMSEIGFVNTGLFRYYYIDINGKESTKFFCHENNFALSFTAFSGKESPFFIQAIEASELMCIKTKTIKRLIREKMLWSRFYTLLLEQSYIFKEEREADFLFLNGKERYVKFIRSEPSLIHRVQMQHIAGYLGLTPVSLSRIRKDLNLII